MKIILISNSPNVLNKQLGKEIDSFDKVVRFNKFETAGYEDYVGKKTDWVSYRACDDVKLIRPNLIEKAFSFITYCIHTNGMKGVARHQKAWFGDKGTIIDEIQCFNLARTIGYKNDFKEWPSIGALALAYFSIVYGKENLTTYGFSGNGEGHYFPKPPKDSCYHNWSIERDYLNSLKIPALA